MFESGQPGRRASWSWAVDASRGGADRPVLNVAVNGLGRVGRGVLRALVLRRPVGVRVVALNDRAEPEALARLLRHDSVHGRWPGPVARTGGHLDFGADHAALLLSEPDPSRLPWTSFGIDVVVEATGRFTQRAEAARHLAAGARRVLVTAPVEGADATIVVGANDRDLRGPTPDATRLHAAHRIVSNGSCTAHAVAPIVRALDDAFGWEAGQYVAVHPVTNRQGLVDAPSEPGSDPRRSRSALDAIVPTESNAVGSIEATVPSVAGRLHGLEARVPTRNVVFTVLSARVRRPVDLGALRSVLVASADRWPRLIDLSDEPLVSADFRGSTRSVIVDVPTLEVTRGHLVRVGLWYDNETGFAHRIVDTLERLAEPLDFPSGPEPSRSTRGRPSGVAA